MQKNFFNLEKEEKDEVINELKASYSTWRDKTKEMNKPFFLIHNDFEHLFLKDISGGALKLFIYLGFRSKYQTGESWESVETVSSFFGKDSRTIAKWFSELEKIGLLERKQKGFRMTSTTFLKPYGFFFDNYIGFPESDVEHVRNDIQESRNNNLIPYFVLMLNYGFKEYTVLVLYKNPKNEVFSGKAFIDFQINNAAITTLKELCKKLNIRMDSYDIDSPISKSNNSKIAVYNAYLKYLNEESSY